MTADNPHAMKGFDLPAHVVGSAEGFGTLYYLCGPGKTKSAHLFGGLNGKEQALQAARAINNFDEMRAALEASKRFLNAHPIDDHVRGLKDVIDAALKHSEEKRRG